jgi:deaminated glutathione amidase
MKIKAACIQLNNSDDMRRNLEVAEHLIRAARDAGAQLVVTPENSAIMVDSLAAYSQHRYLPDEHPALLLYQNLARELHLWLVIGSIAVAVPGTEKLANRSFVIDDAGNIHCTYDKIHLFDVTLPNGEEYRESSRCVAGNQMTLCDTPWGKLGLTICYDVRFPHLYRALAQAGADIITIPAAFTQLTGEAHWHILVRARAIETGCYILAAAQTGLHPGNRKTYGHSLIVNPWGEVLAEGGTEEGFIMAELDMDMVVSIRAKIPSLRVE